MFFRSAGGFAVLSIVAILAGTPGLTLAQPQVRFPDRPGQRQFILDEARLLSPEDREKIEVIAHETLKQTAAPIIVVTIRGLRYYGAGFISIEQYARRLFDHWGIGHPRLKAGGREIPRNLGVLLLVAVQDRKARIELGADWGHRKDAQCREIMDDHIIAAFKREDFSGGILAGVEALAAMVRDEPIPSPPRPSWHYILIAAVIGLGIFTVVSLIRRGSSGWAWLFWGAVFALLGALLYHTMRRRSYGSGGFGGGSFGGGFSGGGGATGGW
jgi:uncharacterized protein